MISQEDGARLMFAANKLAEAAYRHGGDKTVEFAAARKVAERAFAELVAKLTDSEGL